MIRAIVLILLIAVLSPVPPAASAGRQLLASQRIEVADELVSAGATGYRMSYRSTTVRGAPTVVTGVVLLPSGTPPAGGWPVISWAHGTTGIADRCAPSRDRALGGLGYAAYLAHFVRAGYAVAATDYEGLGTPGVHPYLIAESQARSVVDAVRAARDLSPHVSTRWLVVGHSQGGHAALAAAELAAGYGRGLHLRGAVALAPVTDNRPYVPELSRLRPVDHGYYLAILAGLDTVWPIRYRDYLGQRARAELPRVHTTCLDELTNRMLTLNLPGTEFAPRTTAAATRLSGWLGENAVPSTRSAAPVFVAQGLADELVPAPRTDLAVARARALGTSVHLVHYPGTGHYEITETSAADVLRFVAARA